MKWWQWVYVVFLTLVISLLSSMYILGAAASVLILLASTMSSVLDYKDQT